MATTIDHITTNVEARLSELDELLSPLEGERETLLQVLNELNTPSDEQQKVAKASTPKKTQRRNDHKTTAKAASSRKRGEHLERGERKAQIRELLAKEWTPREIAEELGTHVNYVRLVQRQDRDAAEASSAKRGNRRVNVTAKAKR